EPRPDPDARVPLGAADADPRPDEVPTRSVEADPADPDDPDVSAAANGNDAIAAPTPRATASAPTRPT
ncbi:MAG TPA: hypothetical protein PKK01_05680, partial [Mycobacterium sp.]|nr:hypothetical protein [Mycobacterium sp.]